MIGARRTSTLADREINEARYIDALRPAPRLLEEPVGRRLLALLEAGPLAVETAAFVLGQHDHESEVLLRELAARGLARKTPEGWIA